ncbi:cobalt-factor II C(20)-methyltransferase [Pectobacterium sp. B1J-3]|uniref:cobalt-factor II C(20)-methyltransferase n=1 Tax=Pectobacterium sp. B1J-3 TaxID=3385371 RepID=UPI0039065E82
MTGRLYALGVGPGASDLITVRAARLLGTLDILYAPAGRKGGDSLALSIVREYLSPATQICTRHFPMRAENDEKEAVWDEMARQLTDDVANGKRVGFITLGDSMLFSTWVFLLARIGQPPWLEIVPGVTSFAAIASLAAFPLAMEQQSLAIMPCTAPEAELEHALLTHDCVVLMKVYGRFAKVRALLTKLDLLDHALMMSDASLPSEQCWRHLESIDDEQKLPYFSTILVNKKIAV